ncbi:SHC-transforming protein 3 [Harmonia axyridis]|uniref:SHC-transforming protein 3 n=1 Tax=Harmonia axyridis TaxID=115357 RepID=UPI001E2791B2|nr:SHC-transforming protein 3 [Harmonia axyridis]
MSSGIMNKPSGGWIHSDKLIAKQGVTYTVKYVGCLEVKASMKTLDYNTRSSVARECINRVCEAAGLKTVDKRRKVEKNVEKAIADVPNMNYAGTNVNLTVSSSRLSLTSLDSNQVISSHDMPQISFASGGDCDSLDFVAYVAKDSTDWRACYVLECGGGLTKDVIATIGQAFDLRFKQCMKPTVKALSMGQPSTSGGDADKDYYNDLPGKVPPDVGPPPVPPLPTVVPPLTTLPPVQSPNLIDLNSDVPLHRDLPLHNYVNDNVISTRGRDVFDMHPFSAVQLPTSGASSGKKMDPKHLAQLQNEIWFHGQISRAEAEKLLENDGDFLVRESPNSEAQFVLSGMQDNTKKHLLLIDPEGVVRTKDRMFDSVSHLINFHCENALPIISSESALVLRVPIPRMT